MKGSKIFLIVLGAACMGYAAADPIPVKEAQISSADRGGISNWEVVDNVTVLIQDRARHWYKATLRVNCIDLPAEQKIGFESNADGSFDKFSAIRTRQQYCPLASLVRTEAPAKKPRKAAAVGPPASPAPASSTVDVSH
jgi:Family of unknown function (DUF6491)